MDEKEASLYTAILIVCIVLGTIITYFIISIVKQHRRTIQLYRQNMQTEITTLEKERARMAADLHDEVGPVLSSIKLRIGSLDVEDKGDQEEIEKTSLQIDNLIRRMREISFDLMPTSLIRKGLPQALDEFIDNFRRKENLRIRFEYEDVKLSQQQSINLYRIVQEVVHNTVKHSRASELDISLRQERNKVVLITRDNGIGFSFTGKMREAGGHGLHNLQNRTEMMEGKLQVETGKGKGTTFIFEIPTIAAKHYEYKNHSGR